jgi:hypothetical protein
VPQIRFLQKTNYLQKISMLEIQRFAIPGEMNGTMLAFGNVAPIAGFG